jgi:hypothetical protein
MTTTPTPRPEIDASAQAALIRTLVKALKRIASSRLHDMNTLHPDGCARVAAEAIKAAKEAGYVE